MKKLVALLFLVSAQAFSAPRLADPLPLPPSGPIAMPPRGEIPAKFDFRAMSIGQLAQLMYSEAFKTGYVLDPDLLADSRLVSFRYDAGKGDLRSFWFQFLRSLGYSVVTRDGADFVTKAKDEPAPIDRQTFVYKPKYRSVSYLSRMVKPLVGGVSNVTRGIPAAEGAKVTQDVSPESAAGQIEQDADVFVYSGTSADIVVLKTVLPQIDVRGAEVSVRAAAYEVQRSNDRGSAVSLALSLMNDRYGLSLGAVSETGDAIRLKGPGFDLVAQAFANDGRFRVMTQPNLRMQSGQSAHLVVGQKVPVLGSVSYPGSGSQTVQSVQYQEAGVIFDVRPRVYSDRIDLDVHQTISDVVRTTTGVSSSPTFTTRELKTAVSAEDGELIFIGGLTSNRVSEANGGLSWLPDFLRQHSSSTAETEVLLVLEVHKI